MKEMVMDWMHPKEANNQHHTAVPTVQSTREKEEGTTKEMLEETSYGETPKDWHVMGTTKED